MPNLEPCPFCGGSAQIERLGTSRQSCIIACTNCGARLETSESADFCGGQWNRRDPGVAESALPPLKVPAPTEMMPPETDMYVSIKVIQDLKNLGHISLLLVFVTGLQAGITILQLLVRYGIIGE